MNENEKPQKEQTSETPVPALAEEVLTKYFDELASIEGFSDIALELRKLVLQDHDFSEQAIRTILFRDAP